ncbi:MFS transporter [Hujiaoplasma nucleasis]|uniref:MFS transporter n=1 Tax=Hujiaoplasma nucleasis TaxID=2725268 RepID=A0A7L6N2M3_9MOLU|nr:MFS transporter [Hujiaoplasma nucleasis]QLY40516.1 MFS transporter [Hujiaoplasma nucleasis]
MNKKLLKNKNYMLLVIGNFVSLIGSNIQQFVLSLYVLALTGSATIFASMLAISILPRILLSPIAGVFGDWFDKKKSIVILDITNALVLLAFGIYVYLYNDLTIGLIYLLVILLEITEIFFHSSMSAVIPSVVQEDEYLEANSLRMMLVSFGQLLAPVFGALIYGAFGLLVAILINALSFFLSALSEMFIKVPKTKSESNVRSVSGFKKDFSEGIILVKHSKPIRTIMAMAVIVNFSISPFFSVGLIFLLKEVLVQSDMRLGLLQTVLSASMILAPILLLKKLKTMRLGDVLMKSFFIMGTLIVLISFSIHSSLASLADGLASYIYVLVICFIIGILVTGVNISVGTLIQKIVPLEFMGRTSTVLGLFSTIAIPIGQMIFGYLYDIINPGFVFILNGLVILGTVLFFYKRMHLIDDYDKEEVKENLVERSVLVNEI